MSDTPSSLESQEPSALYGQYECDVSVVRLPHKTVILVGTAHVSQESVELVKRASLFFIAQVLNL